MKKFVLIINLIIIPLLLASQNQELEAKIEMKRDTIMIGEEHFWNLHVINKSSIPISIFYDKRGNYHNELNRDSDLIIELKDSLNNVIDQITSERNEITMQSGRVGYKHLSKNDELVFPQWFTNWYEIKKPGNYNLMIKKILKIKGSDNEIYNVTVKAEKLMYFYLASKEEFQSNLNNLETEFRNNKFDDYEGKNIILETIIRSSSITSLDIYDELLNSMNSYNAKRAITALGKLNTSKEAFEILVKHFKSDFKKSISESIDTKLYDAILDQMRLNTLHEVDKFPIQIKVEFLNYLVKNHMNNENIKNKIHQMIESSK